MNAADRLAEIRERADKATSLTLGDDNARDCYNIAEDDVPALVAAVHRVVDCAQYCHDKNRQMDPAVVLDLINDALGVDQ